MDMFNQAKLFLVIVIVWEMCSMLITLERKIQYTYGCEQVRRSWIAAKRSHSDIAFWSFDVGAQKVSTAPRWESRRRTISRNVEDGCTPSHFVSICIRDAASLQIQMLPRSTFTWIDSDVFLVGLWLDRRWFGFCICSVVIREFVWKWLWFVWGALYFFLKILVFFIYS